MQTTPSTNKHAIASTTASARGATTSNFIPKYVELDLPTDYIPLRERCKQIMQASEGFIYAGLTPERLEGAYIERTRWMGLLDAAGSREFETTTELLAWLLEAGEGGRRA